MQLRYPALEHNFLRFRFQCGWENHAVPTGILKASKMVSYPVEKFFKISEYPHKFLFKICELRRDSVVCVPSMSWLAASSQHDSESVTTVAAHDESCVPILTSTGMTS